MFRDRFDRVSKILPNYLKFEMIRMKSIFSLIGLITIVDSLNPKMFWSCNINILPVNKLLHPFLYRPGSSFVFGR